MIAGTAQLFALECVGKAIASGLLVFWRAGSPATATAEHLAALGVAARMPGWLTSAGSSTVGATTWTSPVPAS